MMIEREQRQFQAIADADFVEDVGEVPLDRLFADAEGFRDVFVGGSFGDERNHLQFARGESKGLARRRSSLCGEIA